jgi:hypothetical protein
VASVTGYVTEQAFDGVGRPLQNLCKSPKIKQKCPRNPCPPVPFPRPHQNTLDLVGYRLWLTINGHLTAVDEAAKVRPSLLTNI